MLESLLAVSSRPVPLLAGLFDFQVGQLSPAIVLPVAGMLFALAIIFGGIFAEQHKRRMRHELLRLALEKGQPLPADAFRDPDDEAASGVTPGAIMPRVKPARDDRRSGLVLVAVGVGLFLLLNALVGRSVAWIGALPCCIGVALLVNWGLERSARRASSEPPR